MHSQDSKSQSGHAVIQAMWKVEITRKQVLSLFANNQSVPMNAFLDQMVTNNQEVYILIPLDTISIMFHMGVVTASPN